MTSGSPKVHTSKIVHASLAATDRCFATADRLLDGVLPLVGDRVMLVRASKHDPPGWNWDQLAAETLLTRGERGSGRSHVPAARLGERFGLSALERAGGPLMLRHPRRHVAFFGVIPRSGSACEEYPRAEGSRC